MTTPACLDGRRTWEAFGEPLLTLVLVELGKLVPNVRRDDLIFHWNLRSYFLNWCGAEIELKLDVDGCIQHTPHQLALMLQREFEKLTS